jgi:hypothetical protein
MVGLDWVLAEAETGKAGTYGKRHSSKSRMQDCTTLRLSRFHGSVCPWFLVRDSSRSTTYTKENTPRMQWRQSLTTLRSLSSFNW